MESNEKLLEAARMLKNHCDQQMEGCGKCCFVYSTGTGSLHCGISTSAGVPCGWRVPGESRWLPADEALAAGLKANGYNSVTRAIVSGGVVVVGRSKPALPLDDDMFDGIAEGEIVNLDDIIGQGRK